MGDGTGILGARGQRHGWPGRPEVTMAFTHPEYLVSTDWLAEHLGEDDVRVFETTVFLHRGEGGVRAESGRAEYETGHIPGAGFLELQAEFSDNDQPYRFMMPSAEAFADAAGRHGISETTKLVLYDRLGSQWAARFWWMFRSMGCTGAVVLDGGWNRWTAEGRAVSTEPATYAPATFTPTQDPARFADLAEVRAFMESGGGSCLINALGRDQHSGEDGGRAYGRAGHIPGATNVPSGELIDPQTGLYRPAEELAALFESAGADPAQRVVTYCGGGIAASNDAFVLAMLGYENVAVYDASMSEYAADPSLPLVAD
ncbi:MAG: sulfurtransferase [Chloroflexi bacterium]|nr:sulfurtransferase [Chloroflexota bacterium]